MHRTDLAVVIPLFNKQSEIAATLQSVLDQDYKDFRVFIVDDGSTDDSLSVVKSFDDERITVVRQTNKGVSAARNVGVLASAAEWVALVDADDIWGSSHLSNLVSALNANPGCDVYSSRITSNLSEVELRCDQGRRVNDYPSYVLKNGWSVHSSSVLFSASVWKKAGGFPEGETHGEDILTWYKMSLHGDIFILNCGDVYYNREVEGSAVSIVKDEDDAFIKYVEQQLLLSPSSVSHHVVELRNRMLISKGISMIAEGKGERARTHLWRARGTKCFRFRLSVCLAGSFLPGRFARILSRRYLAWRKAASKKLGQ